jgi:hypothetical protein
VEADFAAMLRALDNAHVSGLKVGADHGLIDVLTPVQFHGHAPDVLRSLITGPCRRRQG